MRKSREGIDWTTYGTVMDRFSSPRRAALLHGFYAWLAGVARANGPPPQRVMDVGCGTGSLSVLLRRSFPRARIDLSDRTEAMARLARVRFLRDPLTRVYRVTASTALSDPAPESVDVIVFCRSWYTLPGHERTARRVLRTLKPGGYCFVLDFCRRPTRAQLEAVFDDGDSQQSQISRNAATSFNAAVHDGTYRLHAPRSFHRLWSGAGAIVEHCDLLAGGANLRAAIRKPSVNSRSGTRWPRICTSRPASNRRR